MRRPASMRGLENLGRVRLSRYFYLRDFLYSEISNVTGLPNIPDDPDTMIAAGEQFCCELLDPLHETFGCVAVRSAFRSREVNGYGNAHNLNCARNEANYAGHIWDVRDGAGHLGACASVVIPWFADQYARGRDWRDLAYWVHDHLPYSEQWYFPKLAAFNLTWNEVPLRMISSYIAPKGKLLAAGREPDEGAEARQARYDDFPPFRGVVQPDIPAAWKVERP